MPGFSTPYDIGNRAADHCRADRFVDFSDYAGPAKIIKTIYDKRRLAELEANFWTFAIKRSVLRAVGTNTLLWTPPSYAAGTTYAVGEVVVDSNGSWAQSTVASNLAHDPATPGVTQWTRYAGPETLEAFDVSVTYNTGELAKSGSIVYLSLVNSNVGNTPPSAANWLAVNGTTVALQILYPLTAGPRTDITSSYAYRKPRGWLRKAPVDPKGGHYFIVGVPTGPAPDDWTIEGDYIVTPDPGPMLVRYVSDFQDVPYMHPMFCEALAASIAAEAAPRIAAPDFVDKAITIAERHYKREIRTAGMVNGIEAGPTSPELDDWIKVRW